MYESSLYFWWEFMGWLSRVLKTCTCLPAVFRLIRRDPLSKIFSSVLLKKIWSRLNLIFYHNQNLFHFKCNVITETSKYNVIHLLLQNCSLSFRVYNFQEPKNFIIFKNFIKSFSKLCASSFFIASIVYNILCPVLSFCTFLHVMNLRYFSINLLNKIHFHQELKRNLSIDQNLIKFPFFNRVV